MLILSAPVLTVVYFFLFETPYRPVAISFTSARYLIPQVIAHKAYHPDYPGNSLEGIGALSAKGINGFEIDIQLSKDGVPVLFHGLDLSEDSNGKGLVADFDLTALKQLFLLKEGKATTSKIPTLEEVLQLYCGKKLFVLDLKAFGIFEQQVTERSVDLVKKYNCQHSVIFDALNPAILIKVRQLDPSIPVSLSFLEDNTATAEETQAQLDQIPSFLRWRVTQNILRAIILPDYLSPRFSVPSDQIQKLAGMGFPLIAWTVDDPELAQRLFVLGASSILSNLPLKVSSEIKTTSVDDASRLNLTSVGKIVTVHSDQDVRSALAEAQTSHLKVSIAGRRHSMGGQTIAPNGLVIDMNSMNRIEYDKDTKLLTAESGASWKEIQEVLNNNGRSVQVMQSDNIFSLGGSLSVNAHGWQPNRAPVASTVKAFGLILSSGKSVTCTRPFSEVCRAALGGYGLIGVITRASLETTENVLLRRESKYLSSVGLSTEFKRHLQQPNLELLYARLRTDSNEFLNEAGVHAYYKTELASEPWPKLQAEALVRMKRAVFRLSERSESGKIARWIAEREVAEALDSKLQSGPLTRNQVMYSDFQFIWPADFSKHDILHEYFVPLEEADNFIGLLKTVITKHRQNLLNVTIRHLKPDEDSILAYARQESLSFVLLFSQSEGAKAEREMELCTRELIDAALSLKGSFYLPYRRHFTKSQLLSAYPNLETFKAIKLKNDPTLSLQNMLWDSFTEAAFEN